MFPAFSFQILDVEKGVGEEEEKKKLRRFQAFLLSGVSGSNLTLDDHACNNTEVLRASV